MRSAIGNSLLMSLVVIFVSAVMLLFVSVLSYSKAYRVKNGIIEIIEKNDGFTKTDADGNNVTEIEINDFLHKSGYRIGTSDCTKVLQDKGVNEIMQINSGYNYCVGKNSTGEKGSYYTVITYVEFNFC